jgi:hypothetical protein
MTQTAWPQNPQPGAVALAAAPSLAVAARPQTAQWAANVVDFVGRREALWWVGTPPPPPRSKELWEASSTVERDRGKLAMVQSHCPRYWQVMAPQRVVASGREERAAPLPAAALREAERQLQRRPNLFSASAAGVPRGRGPPAQLSQRLLPGDPRRPWKSADLTGPSAPWPLPCPRHQ